MKQPHKARNETGETTVKQTVKLVSRNKQPTETVVYKTSDERYLRQIVKQAYVRMHKQSENETPRRNYEQFKPQLEALGYIIQEVGTSNLHYKSAAGKYYPPSPTNMIWQMENAQ